MLAYEWEVFPYSEPQTKSLAKHCGITDSEETAVKHVESIMGSDGECSMGIVYPSIAVYAATRDLSFSWVASASAKPRYCTRTLRGGYRWRKS